MVNDETATSCVPNLGRPLTNTATKTGPLMGHSLTPHRPQGDFIESSHTLLNVYISLLLLQVLSGRPMTFHSPLVWLGFLLLIQLTVRLV
jgi:hypothetical protein